MINIDTAANFLALLDASSIFTFQTFSDQDEGPATSWPTVLHGSLDEHAQQLSALNEAGAGVFVMVNAGDGTIRSGSRTCRTAANVVRVRALFVDLDSAPVAPVLASALSPDWVVQSSPGRWHAYWRVDDCPREEFALVQTALAVKFDGDASVKDLPRVMRIPGFVHRKGAPFLSELYLPAQYDRIRGARDD